MVLIAAILACSILALPARAQAEQMTQNVSWNRLSGTNAYGTMTEIVKKGWSQADSVVIAAFDGYWDALSASALAGQLGAPVLLTGRNSLAADTAAQIKRLKAKNAYVVGGTYWITEKVLKELRALGLTVTRVSGKNAAATSLEVAKLVTAKSNYAIVATDISYHDALAASPFSYAKHAPIFLTENNGKSLPNAAVKAIANGGYSVVIAGGSGSVADGVRKQLENAGVSVTRVSGNNAYETAKKFASWSVGRGMKWSNLGVATVASHYDALTGGALCGKLGSVLLLGDDYSNAACTSIASENKYTMGRAYVLGGDASVGDNTYAKLKQATMTPASQVILDRSKWESRMNLPTDSQVSNYHTSIRSPYLVCWPQFPGTTGWYEYAVDFKADSQPNGTYLSIGNWWMDVSSLESRYATVQGDDGYTAGGAYAGFQKLSDGSTVAIMSVWNIYCTDSSGKTTKITAKKTYPDNPRHEGGFDGEGAGAQVLVDYDWKSGKTYRALVQCGRTAAGNCELLFWVCDLESGAWTHLISYDLGYGDTCMTSAACFLENFDTNYAANVRTMELSNFRVNSREKGTWVSASSAMMQRQFEEWTGSYNYGSTDTCFWAIASGIPNLCTPPEQNKVFYVTNYETGQPY